MTTQQFIKYLLSDQKNNNQSVVEFSHLQVLPMYIAESFLPTYLGIKTSSIQARVI